ncbi:aldose 1-epimerase family protein [Streptomyces sp. NPDC050421]|uniref:aldose 1-epimerase family protein n=1 Tax=Streptomyces sp. NPDC050421 TaxID=3365613 RepID=UPI00379B0A7D
MSQRSAQIGRLDSPDGPESRTYGESEPREAEMTPLSSGSQHLIHHGEQDVQLTEVGAGLRSYAVGTRQVIDGYSRAEMCTGARGHSMIPWPNRIRSGSYNWAGTPHQLDLTEPEALGAIHGLTRCASWQCQESHVDGASFGHTLHPCPGWPWTLECRIGYALDDHGLTVTTTTTNLGPTACPYGTGAHPYLAAATRSIDTAHVQVPGSVYLPVDEAGIPTGRQLVEGTAYDLRVQQPLGDRQIDVAYTDLHRDEFGRARVRLANPDGSAVALWADETYPYLEIFTGDSLPEAGRRRTGLGVEPMTCAPDAFHSGAGLITLQVGQTHRSRWGIDPYD